METSARVEKILEQFKRELLTVTEARQEIMEILYADFMQNNVQA
jgi:Fe2+ or Zn2+ uptake regulation protein